MAEAYIIPLTFSVKDVETEFLNAGVLTQDMAFCVNMWMAKRLMEVCLLPTFFCRITHPDLRIERLIAEFTEYDSQLYKRIVSELAIGRDTLAEMDFRFLDNTLVLWWLNEHAGIQSKAASVVCAFLCTDHRHYNSPINLKKNMYWGI